MRPASRTTRSAACTFVATLACLCATLLCAPPLLAQGGDVKDAMRVAGIPDFPPTDFVIRDAASTSVIGRSRYAFVIDSSGAPTLRGESRYLDGQHDLEFDHFLPQAASDGPALSHFEHTFYKSDESVMLEGRADFRTGSASCSDHRGATTTTLASTLSFSQPTWAGPTLLIPIQIWLKSGRQDATLNLNGFNCVPGPKLFALRITASRGGGTPVATFPPDAAMATIRPVLGWWDVVIAPFIPKLYAWYDPTQKFNLIGVELPRFYRGPLIVLTPERQPQFERAPTR